MDDITHEAVDEVLRRGADLSGGTSVDLISSILRATGQVFTSMDGITHEAVDEVLRRGADLSGGASVDLISSILRAT